MAQARKSRSRKLDGRSLRYLGLLAGLLGLLYLNGFPSAPPKVEPPVNAQRPPAPGAADGLSAEPAPSRTARPAEAWLEALWQADETAVLELLAAGARVNAVLDRRQTRPLHLLFFGGGCEYGASAAGVMPVLELLLAQGADVNVADDRGNTPLMLAAAECDPPPVRRLLAAGADMSARNLLGLTAFELTLSNASPAGLVLTEAGFRLPLAAMDRYRDIYHDEPEVLAHLQAADPRIP